MTKKSLLTGKPISTKNVASMNQRKYLTDDKEVDLFCLYYSINGGILNDAYKRATGKKPPKNYDLTDLLDRKDVKARLKYLVTGQIDNDELLELAKQVISEIKVLALVEEPQDHFTWNHKLKAIELLAKYAKVIDSDSMKNETNNTFIVVRSDDASIKAIEVESEN